MFRQFKMSALAVLRQLIAPTPVRADLAPTAWTGVVLSYDSVR